MKKMDAGMIAKMMMLRGLGYKQAEIAKELDVASGTISYQLKRLRKMTEDHNPKDVFDFYIKGFILEKGIDKK